jgi:drug/metabolite transporter (DMT)-like permease
MHFCVLLWGFSAIMGKLILLDEISLVWYRMLFAGLFFGIILLFQKKSFFISYNVLKLVLFNGMLLALHWVCFYGSVKKANASIAVICIPITSLIVAFIDPIINKTSFKKSNLLLSILMLIGMIIIFYTSPIGYRLGLFLGILASFFVAIFSCINKNLIGKIDTFELAFYEMLGGFFLLSIILLVFYFFGFKFSLHFKGNDYPFMFIYLVFCTFIPFVISLKALKHLSTFISVFLVNLEPIYGMILAAFIFKENKMLGANFYLGAAIIFLGIVIQLYLDRNNRKSTNLVS